MAKTKETADRRKAVEDYINRHTEAQMRKDAAELLRHIETLSMSVASLLEEYTIADVMQIGVHMTVGADSELLMEAQLGYESGFSVEGKMCEDRD